MHIQVVSKDVENDGKKTINEQTDEASTMALAKQGDAPSFDAACGFVWNHDETSWFWPNNSQSQESAIKPVELHGMSCQ